MKQKDSGVEIDKRMLTVTKNYEASAIGRNYKGLDETLKERKGDLLEVGSEVVITGGSHKGL